ncbi:MAG: hypothetical protein E7408_01740 [Ruminococcaceae bacterium]|nr:hypothetical protein [Oscillospiraceae bacterium]
MVAMTKRLTRILAFLLCTLMMSSILIGMSVSAEAGEHLKNGDFENWSLGAPPAHWGFKGGTFGKNLIMETENAHGGEKAAGLKTNESSAYLSQRLDRLVGGKMYTFRAFLLPVKRSGQGGRITVDFMDENGQALSRAAANFADTPLGKWSEVKYSFTVPEDTVWASFLLRVSGGTDEEIYWDDVSLTGEVSDYDPEAEEKEQVAQLQATGLEFVKNGSFEAWGGIGLPSEWAAKGGEMNKEIFMEESDTADGTRALKFKKAEGSVWLSQTVYPLTVGNTYAFSGMLKPLTKNAGGSIVIIHYDVDKIELKKINKAFPDAEVNKWTEVYTTFTVPENTTQTVVQVRLPSVTPGETDTEIATVLWDKISVMGEGELPEPEAEAAFVEMPAFSRELLTNGGFEEGNLPAVTNWSPFDDRDPKTWVDNRFASVVEGAGRDGSRALRITTTLENLPWTKQLVAGENFDPNAVYQASYWFKGEVATVGCKFEWYDADGNYMGGASGHMDGYTGGEWKRFVKTFSPPSECAKVMFYVRIFAPGEAYFDDVSFYMIEEAPVRPVHLSTNEVFFYTDMTEGIATGAADTKKFPALKEGGRVDFQMQDPSGVVLSSGSAPLADGAATWKFDPRQMTEEGQDYTITATIYDAAGNMVGTETQRICRYKRPEMMTPDGQFVIDGEPFYPVFAWHVRATELGFMAEIGVNTTQSVAPLKEYLDEAEKHGIKVVARIYPDMKPAGHPDNYENSKRVISELWNHPALLAWAVMDEPSLKFPNHWDLFYDTYKLVRDIDPLHPVFMIQCAPDYYEEFGKYVDIVALDPYPGSPDKLQKVGNYARRAAQASHYHKGNMVLNQTYLEGTYFPTLMDVRNLWYQALMAGSTSNGFYAFYDATKDENGNVIDLNESDIWPGMVEFKNAEMQESYDLFLKQKYPIFSSFWKTDVPIWTAYVKDGKVSIIVINPNNVEDSVSIPLVSDGGTVSITGFTANVKYGGSGTVASAGSTLDLTLAPNAALVYEITPNTATDFSGLYATKYRDLQDYPWAAEQIRRLENKGIVNDMTAASYAPEKKITRGDFAMFLIRTLGLTSDATELFADVDPNAYYAKEIAIGKALGILKGTDGVNYNPEAEISRQDLMVICARGMRLVRALEEGDAATYLQSFSDNQLIADYATADVAAMVRGNIVKGNADGTVNPRGNTTRAEAAVVMDRILNWSK